MAGPKSASIRSGSRAPRTRQTRANAPTATQADEANPDLGNPSLPDIRTQQSFAYGSTKTPALPRQLELNPTMGLSEMVDTLDDGMRQAEDRNIARIEEQTRTGPELRRHTRSMSASSAGTGMSPTRESASRKTASRKSASRRLESRELTPEDQLLGSLREASEEAEESVSASIPPDAFDDSASVSWTTERHIHRNLLQNTTIGTRANFFRHDPYSSRPSSSHGQAASSVSPTRHRIIEEVPSLDPTLPSPINAPIASASAAAKRTLPPVPAFDQKKPASVSSSSSNLTPSSSAHSSPILPPVTQQLFAPDTTHSRKGSSPTLTNLLLLITVIVATFAGVMYREEVRHVPSWMRSNISCLFGQPTYSFPTENSTIYADALNKLSYRVDQRLSGMSKDIASLKDEWNRRLPHLKEALSRSPAAVDPLAPPKVNFASVGMGAVVDPYLTSPTMSIPSGLVKRIGQYLAKTPRGPPPIEALQPWDGVGECWCAATRSNVSQLAILLGRAIVPEEVVIEHIPRDATLDAGSAPREMELWAQYASRPAPATTPTPATKPSSRSRSRSPSPSRPHPLSPSLRTLILDTLRQAYPNEPETGYSDDALLGPSFFRVGRWQYNLNGAQHIQRFGLDAVIDMPAARVEKVVFRVKSNWGASHTCLYRVRLHGRV
ncbi:hypothetical protein FQN55_002623 [Onygenales sp. PD_40]|nr:hypothetical protein FQN55_002623 [Onygenales sp. PD_40]KAK2762560.1 hypothetical protein FQN53_007450 [Emmonsiellopsis sp. PD_33]KAK2791973.1 hypothetical protein FQN51_001946 [Onygenales sp. PD_10]